ncbi:centrosomal protein of 128 kDa isoform X2 [Denticeps clupeoides]|uniref:centrosomal protein of 128 kDa isoform X2 n=1 Tax=Denticeps clupeoides TaxID=299321 RepID=UPI0010A52576|nr:centrosomal protein of 128 kDa isoform X2 [Denticeps clupeoides]
MESSSESDPCDRGGGRDAHRRRSRERSRDNLDVSRKIDTLASTLQDTSRNLHKVDRMLGQYREHTDDQAEAMATLRENLEESIQHLQSQRLRQSAAVRSASASTLHTSDLEDISGSDGFHYSPTSPLKDYGPRRRSRSSTVRFRDSGHANQQIHTLHQSLRDLRSDQLRLGDDVDREILRRNRSDVEMRKTVDNLTGQIRASKREDSVSSRVERRLQEIEKGLRSERQGLSEKRQQEQQGNLSSELQEAVRRRDARTLEIDNFLKERLLTSESEKSKIERDLERARRLLDQSEGGRDALLQQVEDMRAQLSGAEQERVVLQREVRELLSQQRRQRGREEQQKHRDRSDLEREVQDLRAQLSRSSTLSDLEDLRRAVERKEKERAQLSTHVQALSTDLQLQEQQQLKMLSQLKDLQSRSEESLAERSRAEARLAESDRKREDLRTRAQEAVRQWKVKCRKLERQLEEARTDTDRAQQLCATQAGKDRESVQVQLKAVTLQAEGARRELAEVLGRLAQREEEVRRRDVELAQTRDRQLALEQEVKEVRDASHALQDEARRQETLQDRLREENRRLEERNRTLDRQREQAEENLVDLQASVKELSTERTQLSSRLAQEEASRRDLQQRLTAADEERVSVVKRLETERDVHRRELAQLQESAQEGRARQDRDVQETHRLYQKEREEMQAQLRELKADAMAEKDVARTLQLKLDKMKVECDRLAQEMSGSEDARSQLNRKCQALKKELEDKVKEVMRADELRKGTEGSIEDLHDKVSALEVEQQAVLQAVGDYVYSACQALSKGSDDKLKAIEQSPGLQKDPHRWLAETKTKLQWLCEEVREREGREKRARRQHQQSREQIKELKRSRDAEQQVLLQRLSQQEKLLEDVHTERRDLLERSRRKDEEMRRLQDRVLDLEMSTKVALDHLESVPDKLSLLENFKDLEESQRQREAAEQRYAKYREIVGNLLHQLEESKHRIQEYRSEKLDAASRSIHLAGLSSSIRTHHHSFLSSSPSPSTASPEKLLASPESDSGPLRAARSPLNGAGKTET